MNMPTLNDVIAQFTSDTELAHRIVHGDAGTTVTTEGGPVRSFAKLEGDFLTGQVVSTFASLPAQRLGFYLVLADETKSGAPAIYFFTATDRYWLAMVKDA